MRRHEVLAAAGLCVIGVGVASASLPASFAFDPSGSDGAGVSGSSLLALLVALVHALAELLGVPLPDRLGAPAGGGLLALVLAAARAAVPYLPAAAAALAVGTVAVLARSLWSAGATVALAPSRPAVG